VTLGIGKFEFSLDKLLFQEEHLLAEFRDLEVFFLLELTFLSFYLLILLGHLAQELAHVCELVLVLKFLDL
jgi:hypothetical protein